MPAHTFAVGALATRLRLEQPARSHVLCLYRLWKHKLPDCCNEYDVSGPFTNWLAAVDQEEDEGSREKGLTVGKLTLGSYKELAWEVGKCVRACKECREKEEDTSEADWWMDTAIRKWNTGVHSTNVAC